MTDFERNHKHHVRSDTLYLYLTPDKMDMRMTCDWSCKEPPVDNDQKPKLQSSHIILNEQPPSELHVTQMTRR